MAAAGDTTALRLCLDRIIPPRKDRPINFALPQLKTADDAVKATAAIGSALAAGEITPSEGSELAKVVESFTNAVLARDLEKQVSQLQKRVAARG